MTPGQGHNVFVSETHPIEYVPQMWCTYRDRLSTTKWTITQWGKRIQNKIKKINSSKKFDVIKTYTLNMRFVLIRKFKRVQHFNELQHPHEELNNLKR